MRHETRAVEYATRVVGDETRAVGDETRAVGDSSRVVRHEARVVGDSSRAAENRTRVLPLPLGEGGERALGRLPAMPSSPSLLPKGEGGTCAAISSVS